MQYYKIEMPDAQISNWLWAIFNQSRALLNTGVPPVVWPQPDHLTTPLHTSVSSCVKKKKKKKDSYMHKTLSFWHIANKMLN